MFEINFTEVTWPVWGLWGLGLLTLLIGFLIGYVDSNLRSEKKIEAAETKGDAMRVEAEKRLSEAKIMIEQAPKTIDDPGALRLKITKNIPMLEMDGAVINVKTVTADQKKRLIELLSWIRPFLESGPSISQPISRPLTSTSQTPPEPAAIQDAVVIARATTSASPTQPLPAPRSEEEKKFKTLSMMSQIDRVLQVRIAGTRLEGMVSVGDSIGGGIEVLVGKDKYEAIDDIPDPEIQKIIRAAIADWEQRYTPGLS